MLRRLCIKASRSLAAPSTLCFVQFAAVAICMATWPLQFLSLLGTSLSVTLALIAALAVGFAIGARKCAVISRMSVGGFSCATLLHFVLAVWMVVSPQLVELVDWAISQPGLIRLGSPYWNGIVLFGLALVTLGLPAFVAGQLVANLPLSPAGRPRLGLVFLAVAVGLCAWAGGLAQVLGPYYCGLAAASLGLATAAVESLLRTSRQSAAATLATASLSAASPHVVLPPAPAAFAAVQNVDDLDHTRVLGERGYTGGLGERGYGQDSGAESAESAILAAACGGWVAALDRLLVQLSPGSIYLGCAELIGLCCGLSLGILLVRWGRGGVTKLAAILCLSLWGIGLLAAYPLLIELSLWLNASVSSTHLLILLRGLSTGLAVLPVGIAAAAGLSRQSWASESAIVMQIGAGFLAAAAGFYVVDVPVFKRVTLDVVVIGLAWVTVATTLRAVWSMRGTLFARWPARGLIAAAGVVLLLAPQWRHNFDPARSAKVLFNSNVSYAYRSGIKPALLATLDEGRHVSTSWGQRGIFTVWSYGGHQLQVRENGLPRGVVSTDPEAFPRYAPETLQTAVPCLIHGKPERLLLLGLGSGEALATALAFPIQEITCLETDPGLVRVVRNLLPAGAETPLDDERVTLSICDPALGLPAVPGEFDVVVSSPENLSLAQSQPYVTIEFYRRAAKKLSPGGVFCQRLLHIDLGPRAIQAITAAMLTVFSDVQAVEVAPGELLLCATNDEQGLIRPGLVSRMEMPHVRTVLGESGLDWTVLLNVAAVNRKGLVAFCKTLTGPPNSASSSRLALSLPREMMRWAPKLDELRAALEPHCGRIVTWVGEDGNTPVVIRRLAEVQGQQELMTKYSDQYWAYRASLRDQVKEKPRSAIQLTSALSEEKTMHPEDRRRVAYFTALSRAIRTRSMADISRLSQLSLPYDPLITYFVHQEAAELMSNATERDPATELRLRLYATYFSSPKDFSLRNVIAGLALLREHPECEPDLRARWDDCNALLQALKMRWEARIGVRPSDIKEVINDIDQTVLAAEQTFRALDTLTVDAGISPELWRARKSILERTLIAPVRAYQQELLSIENRRAANRDEP
jgi:hypothetical protein